MTPFRNGGPSEWRNPTTQTDRHVDDNKGRLKLAAREPTYLQISLL